MAERLGTEAADLQIVFHDGEGAAQLVHAGCEKAPLIIEAWSPGEDATNVQPFAFDLPEHILRRHAFGGARVMGATGAVDVMIAGIKTVIGWANPALELKLRSRIVSLRSVDLASECEILGAAAVFHGEFARWQEHCTAIAAVYLVLEIEVGSEALGLRWENVAGLIAKYESGGRRFSVVIPDAKFDRHGGLDIE